LSEVTAAAVDDYIATANTRHADANSKAEAAEARAEEADTLRSEVDQLRPELQETKETLAARERDAQELSRQLESALAALPSEPKSDPPKRKAKRVSKAKPNTKTTKAAA
jgi:seryl-tRNA synthetase